MAILLCIKQKVCAYKEGNSLQIRLYNELIFRFFFSVTSQSSLISLHSVKKQQQKSIETIAYVQ